MGSICWPCRLCGHDDGLMLLQLTATMADATTPRASLSHTCIYCVLILLENRPVVFPCHPTPSCPSPLWASLTHIRLAVCVRVRACACVDASHHLLYLSCPPLCQCLSNSHAICLVSCLTPSLPLASPSTLDIRPPDPQPDRHNPVGSASTLLFWKPLHLSSKLC